MERHPQNEKRRKILRDAATVISTWAPGAEIKHHVADGRISMHGRTVLRIQNNKLVPAPGYHNEDTLMTEAWNAVDVPLAR